jgi:hypothetical protein
MTLSAISLNLHRSAIATRTDIVARVQIRLVQSFTMEEMDLWQQLASDNARAHAFQNLEELGHLFQRLERWLVVQPWQQHYDTLRALLRANDTARWALTLAMGCFALALLLRSWRLCKSFK